MIAANAGKARAKRWLARLRTIEKKIDDVFVDAMNDKDEYEYFTDLLESMRETTEMAINCAEGLSIIPAEGDEHYPRGEKE